MNNFETEKQRVYIYGLCTQMKRTNEEATLNNWKRDETKWKMVKQEITKLIRGLNYLVWSLRSITYLTTTPTSKSDEMYYRKLLDPLGTLGY